MQACSWCCSWCCSNCSGRREQKKKRSDSLQSLKCLSCVLSKKKKKGRSTPDPSHPVEDSVRGKVFRQLSSVHSVAVTNIPTKSNTGEGEVLQFQVTFHHNREVTEAGLETADHTTCIVMSREKQMHPCCLLAHLLSRLPSHLYRSEPSLENGATHNRHGSQQSRESPTDMS